MRYQIAVYVPLSHVDIVKIAVFSEGAGRFSGYEACCWQTEGQGQFLPMADANPYAGVKGQITHQKEMKLEFFCDSVCIRAVIAAMKKAHPYEVPAFFVLEHCHAFD